MRKALTIFLVLAGWFAVIAQYLLLMKHRTIPAADATIQFFSYFTILTNILVAVFFSLQLFGQRFSAGALTAVTVYISVVGLVYQLTLRQIWDPQGLQRVVDELLHTVIPAVAIFFWYRYVDGRSLSYPRMFSWFIYPLVYLLYTLVHGAYTGFYPYPFVDVNTIGLGRTILNAGLVTLLFAVLSAIYITIARKRSAVNDIH